MARVSTTDPTVVAVTGEVPAASLGAVLPHEHLLSDFAPPDDTPESWARAGLVRPAGASALRLYRAPLTMDLLGEVALGAVNRDDRLLTDEALAVSEAAAFRDAGGGTIVDLTPPAHGRNPAALRRLAESTGLTIVMGTVPHITSATGPGFSGPLPDAGMPGGSSGPVPDAGWLVEGLVRELSVGVGGVRAGVIGALPALDPGVPGERNVLVAAARASAATGAAISLGRSGDALAQQRVLDLLAEEGADLGRVAVGHCDPLAPDPDALEPLLARGVFVQFDQLGRLPSAHSVADDQDVAAAVLELARRGHATRVLLSQDVRAKSHLLAYGGGGYGFLLQQFVPYLRMLGADDGLIETVTVDNPRRLLQTPKADS
ncbi:MAG: phosphotriesterase [Nonomuraea sp.]|nr:phosphotriesterase [Nonomuraea sp.]